MNLDNIKETVWAFMAGKEFLLVVGAIILYIVLTGALRRTFNLLFGWVGSFMNLFGAMRWRRLFFNFIALVFMVGGVTTASAARAKLNGGDGVLEAIVGGGFALAAWAVMMMIFNQFTPRSKPRRKSKVELPSSLRK